MNVRYANVGEIELKINNSEEREGKRRRERRGCGIERSI